MCTLALIASPCQILSNSLTGLVLHNDVIKKPTLDSWRAQVLSNRL